MSKVVEFDPGYGPYVSSLAANIEYAYQTLAKFKNMGQKKFQYKTMYNQISKLFENNVGFYLGCMLWATVIKAEGSKEIINNPCFGSEYSEESNILEIDYVINFVPQFKRDCKYYLGLELNIEQIKVDILNLYKEFIVANKGFVNCKTTDDIILPDSLKTPATKDLTIIKEKISEVTKNGKLCDLIELADKIIPC